VLSPHSVWRLRAHETISEGEETLMGMFTDLMHKIFRPSAAASAQVSPGAPSESGGGGSAATAQPVGAVDVAVILDTMARESKQKLDWRHSIVDLMKLVGMDSSLNARRELAADLNYSGDTSDTATMNIWLHKQVMKKLAENGGKVPPDLLAA
jgi:hypothetical protein